MEAEKVSFVKEIEGYLNNKRCLYEAEGRREYLPLVDQALNLIRNMRNVSTTDTPPIQQSQQNQQSACNHPTFDRPAEKMYHYAEGEAIDCAICIEHIEANHAQVRLSCGHIYHLNCIGSHFNHSGDYKCPYCRIEVDKYAKQPRIWEHPVNAPPQTPNQIEADIPHPGELDFANFQRGVLQVVNSLFGGRLNLGHPFRNDNGTEEDYYDNEEDSPSENDDTIYDTRYLGSNDSESSDDSDESEDDREYDHDSNIGFRSQRNSYYSSSNEALASSTRRTNSRLGMDSTLRTRSISRNRPRPDSMSGSAFRSRPNRPSSFAPDTTPRSEVNEMSRHASTSSRLRNMYQDDSTTDDLMDGESDSSHSSSEDSDDEDEVMFTDASNDMDTSDEDSGSENEDYRSRSYSHRSSLSVSPVSSSDEEERENDNESVVTASTNNSNQQWYKLPWSWSLNATTTTSASTIAASDTDATISSGDDFE